VSFPNGLTITNNGRILQAKAQTGVQLQFTKIQIGDGQLSGQLPGDMTALINSKKDVAIIKLSTLANGKASLKGTFNNSGLAAGYYFREIGVFATDPDLGEILYCYGNADTAAEYIPAQAGASVIEKYISVITIVGNAANVSAVIDASNIYYTQDEVLTVDQTQAPATPGNGKILQLFNWLANRIKAITGKANWWDAPDTTLAAAKTHINAAAPHSGHETPAGAQAKADEAAAAGIAAAGTVQTALTTHEAEKATINAIGHIKPDGATIAVDVNGTISTTSETVNRIITVGVGKDFTTIQAAVNSIKKRVDATITINVDAGTYAEDVLIKGFGGAGSIIVNGGTDLTTAVNYIVNSIDCSNNTIMVRVIGFTANTTTKVAFAIVLCLYGHYKYCRTVVSATTQIGFYVQNALGYIEGCLASNKDVALYVAFMSTVSSSNWSAGSGNTYGIRSMDASTVGKVGTQPQGTTPELQTNGGIIR
jgi:hypothetical protein